MVTPKSEKNKYINMADEVQEALRVMNMWVAEKICDNGTTDPFLLFPVISRTVSAVIAWSEVAGEIIDNDKVRAAADEFGERLEEEKSKLLLALRDESRPLKRK